MKTFLKTLPLLAIFFMISAPSMAESSLLQEDLVKSAAPVFEDYSLSQGDLVKLVNINRVALEKRMTELYNRANDSYNN